MPPGAWVAVGCWTRLKTQSLAVYRGLSLNLLSGDPRWRYRGSQGIEDLRQKKTKNRINRRKRR